MIGSQGPWLFFPKTMVKWERRCQPGRRRASCRSTRAATSNLRTTGSSNCSGGKRQMPHRLAGAPELRGRVSQVGTTIESEVHMVLVGKGAGIGLAHLLGPQPQLTARSPGRATSTRSGCSSKASARNARSRASCWGSSDTICSNVPIASPMRRKCQALAAPAIGLGRLLENDREMGKLTPSSLPGWRLHNLYRNVIGTGNIGHQSPLAWTTRDWQRTTLGFPSCSFNAGDGGMNVFTVRAR